MPKLCQDKESGCIRTAQYALPGDSPQVCSHHIKKGMVYAKKKKECAEDKCTKSPSYGLPGGKATHCEPHKKGGMIDVIHKTCTHESGCTDRANWGFLKGKGKKRKGERLYCGKHYPRDDPRMLNLDAKRCKDCDKKATYGKRMPGKKKGSPIYCPEHKKPGMVELTHKKCEYDPCNVSATFGDPAKGISKRCGTHRLKGMIDLKHKRCENCSSTAVYGFPGGSPTHCAKHGTDDMVNITGKKCAEDGCTTSPSFGHIHGTPLYCFNHKTNDMVGLKNRRCRKQPCTRIPIYGHPNGKIECCIDHIEDGMINLQSKMCIHPLCQTQSSYGFPEGKMEWCSGHANRKAGMIDLKHPRCEIPGCKNSRSHRYKGKKLTRCGQHKETDMIDTKHTKCDDEKCDQDACYGIPGNKPTKCKGHKVAGMIKHPNRRCNTRSGGKRCREIATHGDDEPEHCEKHMKTHEFNLVENKCKSCNLLTILNEQSYCEACNPGVFEKVRMVKQTALMTYLDKHNLHGQSTDKAIYHGECGLERPDRVFELVDKVIILECDEHQHRHITRDCEEIRMFNISQQFESLPVYFIRWNPDKYRINGKSTNNETLRERYKYVATFIQNIIDNQMELPHAFSSVIYMYYDEWTGPENSEWQILTNFD